MTASEMKILAIDDKPENLEALQEVLAQAQPGITVLTALDGAAGLEAARREDPDVILLDIVMPGMDGYEVCRAVKADPLLRELPVLFLTALETDRESRLKAMDAGAEGFLAKPVDTIELLAQIRAMAKIKEASRARRLEKEDLAGLVTLRTLQLVQELSERRRVEADLRASNELLRQSQAVARIGHYVLDIASGTWTSSETLDEIFGIGPAHARTVEGWLSLVHPEERAALGEYFAGSVLSERRPFDREYRIVRPFDGATRWVHGTGRLDFGPDGRPLRMFGVIQDVDGRITVAEEARLAQAALALSEGRYRHLAAELEQRVRERTEALAAANRELESFSYSVSHDLRAPLRAIAGFSELVVEDYGERLDEEGRRLLGVVRANAARMSRLIDDLLKFSRAGRGEIRCERVAMGALARSVFLEVAGEAAARGGVDFRVGELPDAEGDAALLRQVWINLLGNAVKFTSKTQRPAIEVSGALEGGQTVYRVSDNGAGFDLRYADKLFGVFQRLHAADQYEGTGIGLALVQRIVARHGGSVRAHGTPAGGATFSFALPAPSAG